MLKSKLRLLMFALCIPISGIFAQNKLVTGTVVDTEGTPLPGVTVVLVRDYTKGVITSIDGKYAIADVMPTDTLRFSYISFATQNIFVGTQSVIDVVMKEDVNELEEFTVVAFQKQKKESVIGSITTVSAKELKGPQSNLTTALAGKMSGIISYQTSGEPGQDNAQFFVRGVTTFGYKSSPLILIDGLEVTTEDLARLEPDNVASFSIMKDATATALYGARGANGVILVTTKVGKKGKMSVSARIETSISTPTKIQEMLDGVSYMELYNQALRTREPNALLYYSKDKIEGTRNGGNSEIYPNVDWYNDLFKSSVTNYKANLSASGGGDVAQYYLSVAYTNEKGLLKVDNLNNFNNNIDIKRYNIRANVDFNFTKTTKGAVKVYSLLDQYNGPATEASDIFSSVMNANPVNFPKYYSKTGDNEYLSYTLFGNKGNGSYPNPYAEMVKGYKDRFTATNQAQFQVEQDLSMLTKGLKLRGLASFSVYSKNESSRTFDPYFYGLNEVETATGVEHSLYMIHEGTASLNDPSIYNYTSSGSYFEGAAQYDRVFNDKHSVGALLVATAKESLNKVEYTPEDVSKTFTSLPSRNVGLSGRLSYGFDNRYFVEGNFGYNGSEKFSKENRFGFFPSAGLAWTVSNEKFYSSELRKILPSLKFKATYGLVGNDDISASWDRFFYLSEVNTSHGEYGHSFGSDFSNWYNGYLVSRYSNADVSWEVAKKANYGVEMNFFDKLSVQVDYFTENRSNIYMLRDYIPASMGLTADISSNIGKAKSWGIDGSADLQLVFNKDFWMTSRFNFTYATNEYVRNGEPDYEYEYRSRIGHSINQQWGYVAERLFIDEADIQNSPVQFNQTGSILPGDIKYVDLNNDGVIDENDQTAIGYPTVPEIIYGFGTSLGWKDFDFSFFFQGSARSSFFLDPTDIAPFINERNALKIIADDYWSETNPDPYAFWPRMSVTASGVYTADTGNNVVPSTWWLRNGSFLRLKSLELGYSLPKKLVKKWNLELLRVYVNGSNLMNFSDFKLWDTEMGANGLGYPTQRIYNIGLQVTF